MNIFWQLCVHFGNVFTLVTCVYFGYVFVCFGMISLSVKVYKLYCMGDVLLISKIGIFYNNRVPSDDPLTQ